MSLHTVNACEKEVVDLLKVDSKLPRFLYCKANGEPECGKDSWLLVEAIAGAHCNKYPFHGIKSI